MSDQDNQSFREKRLFPRQAASCPVVYRTPESQRWIEGRLVDFSAAGLRLECDELLMPGTPVSVELQPGDDRTIPAVICKGHVVRCEPNLDLRYEVSCKLTKVKPVTR